MGHARTVIADLLRVHPAAGTRVVALRAGATILVPLLVLAGTDRLTWGLYAVFGAFAAVYGGSTAARGRWRVQAHAGSLLVAAATTGAAVALSEHRAWLAVPVAAAWAALAADASDRRRWVPPGPLFVVFAVGACSARPTEPHEVPVALGIAGGTAALALALGVLDERRPRPAPPAPAARHTPPAADRRRLHVARVAVAVGVAGVLATASGIGHPYWAMVAAVVPLAVPRLRAQVVRALQRALGTTVGIGLAAVLLSVPLSPLAAVLVAAALQGVAELLVVRNYGAALVFITPLALLMGHLAHPEPVGDLVVDRLAETLLGIAVGLLVAWVTRQRPAPAVPAPPAPPGPSLAG
ncbi:FUSC family protein [Nocardioides sp. CPCC 205120]|uniref:FUSC family protein n=1 Tax=Nocardioides sp. CPCC 205120 TaxID=3406462 RepID=UPI003B513C36